jgi:hypothetical protein
MGSEDKGESNDQCGEQRAVGEHDEGRPVIIVLLDLIA